MFTMTFCSNYMGVFDMDRMLLEFILLFIIFDFNSRLTHTSNFNIEDITLDVIIVIRYYFFVIKSFRDKETEKIFNRQFSGKLAQDIQHAARKKLIIIDAAMELEDLRIPPGNQLEKLKGNRKGQYSIRINDQWRICFKWKTSDAHDVEITDYH